MHSISSSVPYWAIDELAAFPIEYRLRTVWPIEFSNQGIFKFEPGKHFRFNPNRHNLKVYFLRVFLTYHKHKHILLYHIVTQIKLGMQSQPIIRSVQSFSDDTAAPPYEKKLSEFAAIIQQVFFAKFSYIERNYAILTLNSYPRVAQNLDI